MQFFIFFFFFLARACGRVYSSDEFLISILPCFFIIFWGFVCTVLYSQSCLFIFVSFHHSFCLDRSVTFEVCTATSRSKLVSLMSLLREEQNPPPISVDFHAHSLPLSPNTSIRESLHALITLAFRPHQPVTVLCCYCCCWIFLFSFFISCQGNNLHASDKSLQTAESR